MQSRRRCGVSVWFYSSSRWVCRCPHAWCDVTVDLLLLSSRQGFVLGIQSISQELEACDAAIAPGVGWWVDPVRIFDMVCLEEGALRAELEEGGLVFWSDLELKVRGAGVEVTAGQICPGGSQKLLQLGVGWRILGKKPAAACLPAPPFPLELGPSAEQPNGVHLMAIFVDRPDQGG